MNTFIVVRNGVYRHEILGVFPSSRDALEVAVIAIKQECDSYHDFEVLGYAMSNLVEDGELTYRVIREDVRDDNRKLTEEMIITVRGPDGTELTLL